MISSKHLEGLAWQLHDETGVSAPVDALELAALCGLRLKARGGAKAKIDLENGVIVHPVGVRLVRLHGLIAHELGHWLLFREGLNHLNESAARYLAGCLMLPREQFLRDLARADWDLFALMAMHPHCSAEMIVCRMTQVSPATASVWDSGHWTRSYGAHDVDGDRELVDAVLGHEHVVRGVLDVYPLFDGVHRRVVCVRRAA